MIEERFGQMGQRIDHIAETFENATLTVQMYLETQKTYGSIFCYELGTPRLSYRCMMVRLRSAEKEGYHKLSVALELHFGEHYWQQLFRARLRTRKQKVDETLQDPDTDVINPSSLQTCYRCEIFGHLKKNCRVVLSAATRSRTLPYDFKAQHFSDRHHHNAGALSRWLYGEFTHYKRVKQRNLNVRIVTSK